MSSPRPDAPPSPTGRLDAAYADSYARLVRAHWWWRSREWHVARWIHRVAEGRRLRTLDVVRLRTLDIGCAGGLAWPSFEADCELEGIEPDPRLVPPGSPHEARIRVGPFPQTRPASVPKDLVLMMDVLEHLEHDVAALEAVREILAPGGHVLLTVPALQALWSEWDVVNGHYRRYSKQGLRDVLRAAGFEPLRIRYYFAWTVGPLLLRRLAYRGRTEEASAFVDPPPAVVNEPVRLASQAEHALSDLLPLPFGSSLIALARKE